MTRVEVSQRITLAEDYLQAHVRSHCARCVNDQPECPICEDVRAHLRELRGLLNSDYLKTVTLTLGPGEVEPELAR